jgi:hypothetical protein
MIRSHRVEKMCPATGGMCVLGHRRGCGGGGVHIRPYEKHTAPQQEGEVFWRWGKNIPATPATPPEHP